MIIKPMNHIRINSVGGNSRVHKYRDIQ